MYSKGCQVENALQTSFCCETNIIHATWCKFYVEDKDQILNYRIGNLQKFYKTAVDCVCLVDSYTLKVFTEFGENYSSSLQFKVMVKYLYFSVFHYCFIYLKFLVNFLFNVGFCNMVYKVWNFIRKIHSICCSLQVTFHVYT